MNESKQKKTKLCQRRLFSKNVKFGCAGAISSLESNLRQDIRRKIREIMENQHCYQFFGHCGAFCGLKWRIWRAKMYFVNVRVF